MRLYGMVRDESLFELLRRGAILVTSIDCWPVDTSISNNRDLFDMLLSS